MIYVWRRLNATRWQSWLRTCAPAAVGAAFLVGVVLAIPHSKAPTGFAGLGLRSMTAQAAHSALQLVRDTRDVARHVRSTVLG